MPVNYESRCLSAIQTNKAIENGYIGSAPYSLINTAWACFNIEDLLSLTTRGENFTAPGFDGQTARNLSRDQLTGSLQFIFDGVLSKSGTPRANPVAGLELNRRDFIANVVEPPAAPSTRTLSVTLADGTTQTAAFQATSFTFRYNTNISGMAFAVVSFRLPAGRLS
jgi:hypothetical protein